ncbi:MAG: IPT/TIG domain-containing protein, partial [Elusimicrobiota bacterium]|nr:IPT/TIG domain-containing protein [Elusimicrobiota bacterium]
SGKVESFSTYIVVYPVQETPNIYASIDTVSGQSAFVMQTDRAVTAQSKDPLSAEMEETSKELLAGGLLPVTNIYEVSDALSSPYQPYALVTMAYDENVLNSYGILESSISLCGFDNHGNYERLTNVNHNFETNILAGRVYSPEQYYAVCASTTPVPLPLPDMEAPIISVSYETPIYKPSPYFAYSSSEVTLSIGFYDLPTDTSVVSEIYETYYKMDLETEFLQSGLNGETTQYFSIYSTPLSFNLSEGRHILAYGSVDNNGNYEQVGMENIYVDITPPETQFSVEGSSELVDNVVYAMEDSTFSLRATDILSNGVATGIKETYFLIDVSTMDCLSPPTLIGPQGTCDNPLYSEPFTLSFGSHTLNFFSDDNVGNTENYKTVFISVGNLPDTTAPVTTLDFTRESYESEGKLYTSTISSIALTADDPQIENQINSGIATIYYMVDVDSTTAQPLMYSDPFALSEGAHTVSYASVDNAGNFEDFKSEIIYIDGTTPITTIEAGGSVLGAGETAYITVQDSITLTAADPISNGVVSGIAETVFLIDRYFDEVCENTPEDMSAPQGTCANPNYAAAFTLLVGTHTIYYASADNVDNEEEIKSVYFVNASTSLMILSASPSSGPIGMPFTLNGFNFGTYSSGKTTVLIGGTTAPLILWNDMQIKGTVPGTLAPGDYDIKVQIVGGATTTISNALNFTLTNPVLNSLAPSSGPIGMPFTIDGISFGNYSSGKTTVLIGGATAPLTLWTDTQIKGTIPGTLENGEHAVIVERNINGGLTQTSSMTFTLTIPQAYSLSPSSGPIGLPFTIDGISFGTYSSGKTTVLIGGATAPLTLWTNTQIKGTIPGTIDSGNHSVIVERNINGGLVQTSPMAFDITLPQAYSIIPSSGPIGTPFTIEGTSFGNYSSGKTTVLIGDTTALLTLWTNTQIKGKIPGALAPGTYDVIVERNINNGLVQTAPIIFVLNVPEITGVNPLAGPIGNPFTVTGFNFDSYSSQNTRILIGGATAPLTLWSNTQVKGTIPGTLAPGDYELSLEREVSGIIVKVSTYPFTVLAMAAYNIEPSSGPIGMPFTIEGESFGNYSSGKTTVLIGGTTAPLTLWTNTQIKGTMPGTLETGNHAVIVERNINGGLTQTSSMTFTLTAPQAYSLSPSSGPIGMPFTIEGISFGNYSSGKTTVLIGGTTAPLTLWTNTQIKGTIPGTLETGNYSVIVERNINGGLVQTSPLSFEIIAPQINSIGPAIAAVGAPFVLTGAGFGNYSSGKTKVIVGGFDASLTLWTDARIKGRLPFLLEGEYPVIMQREINDGLVSVSTSIAIAELTASSITPTSGAGGTAFKIYGEHFGPYDSRLINGERASRVKIGGITSSLSYWTNNQINGLIPDEIAYGTQTVMVERASLGGTASSNPLEFYVPEGTFASFSVTASNEAEFIISSESGGYIETAGRSAVEVPEEALEEETVITIESDEPTEAETEKRDKAMKNKYLKAVGPAIKYGPHGLRFSKEVELKVPYSGDEMPSGKTSEDLSVYWWKAEGKAWEKVESQAEWTIARLKAQTEHFSVYQVMAEGVMPQSAADFIVGEHYFYPNPAKNSATAHFECGTADNAQVTIYDVSGHKVHSADITSGFTTVNGKYAYRYNWDIRKQASGVYIYILKAKKGGSHIIRKGKMAIVK